MAQNAIIHIGGTAYNLAPFSLTLLQKFFAWSVSQLPNPLTELRELMPDLPPALQERAFLEARDRARVRGTVHDAEALQLFGTPVGLAKAFHLMLLKAHPTLTESEAVALFEQAEFEDRDKLFGVLRGSIGEAFPDSSNV